MSMMTQFAQDAQGRRFRDVMEDSRIDFAQVLSFFDSAERQHRMIESETIHERPALAGVIKELEALPTVSHFFETTDGHDTRRFRQAVGVIVRIVMENQGWRTTGQKGSLGTREKIEAHTTAPGAYRNIRGLSKWFTRAERYQKRD